MNAQNAHAHEDRLLDFAYGELPASEAHALEQHVQGCARCTKALADIRGVRTTMAQLSSEPAPDAGLESLLAYAQQSARRAAAGPEPKPSRWRRWLLPAVGLATVSTFGLLTLTVSENLDLSPNLSQRAAPSPAMEAAKQDSRTREKSAPTAMAPAPSSATLEEDVPEGASDALAAAPSEREFDKNRVEAKVQRKGTAAARPSDWMNAGSGGALLERRADAEAPRKKMSKAVRDADGEFAALEQAPAGAVMPVSPPKEEAADEGYAAKDEPARRSSPGKLGDKAMGSAGDSLRLGEAAYGRGLGMDDDQSVAAGAPPPPPAVASAPVVQAEPMAPAAVGSIGGARPPSTPPALSTATPKQESARAEAAKPVPLEKSASKEAMTARDLSAQAQAAANQGDRAREAQLLRAALSAGASGSERLALLSRLCESESVQGRTQEAAAVCGQIISEAPGSSAAQLAQRRLRQASPPTAPAKAAPAQPAQ
ncbi:hypothetical protein EJ065_4630 [Corallococcus coralloides]|uniref:Putative zinc-finger domain-containing protein n=1 Tax=Corallococcus coralloides TaxID=184914 RepID=A0A410RWE4_CORCK|nr:zf-HC2 domain-containing protein [Corallococcus coralloides]QAT86178.1 hypothetical protein EJ065_4630 [Corallococcus coralloides]